MEHYNEDHLVDFFLVLCPRDLAFPKATLTADQPAKVPTTMQIQALSRFRLRCERGGRVLLSFALHWG